MTVNIIWPNGKKRILKTASHSRSIFASETLMAITSGLKAKVASPDSSKGTETKKPKAKFADSKSTANNNRHEVDTSKEEKSEFDTQVDDMLKAVN